MSYLRLDEINFNDNTKDAFSRLRVSHPYTEFDSKFENNDDSYLFNTVTTGTASATYLPNESSIQLTVGTTLGDKVVRESVRYMHYQPGKGLTSILTGLMPPATAGVVGRIGYFDDSDGYYFAQTATGPQVVERTSVSGGLVENAISQASWNYDKMDGTGPSGVVLDITKTQIFMLDLQWLGVGRVRMGFDVDGQLIPVHEFKHSNLLTTVYTRTANLPLRFELENVSASAGATMKQICSTVISEGGYTPIGKIFEKDNGIAPVTVSTTAWTPLISLQTLGTLNSKRVRGFLELAEIDFLNTSTNEVIFQIVQSPVLTGAVWTGVGNGSFMNYDVSSTAATGGVVRSAGYINSGTVSVSTSATYKLPGMRLYSSPQLASQPIFTVQARALGTAATVLVSVNWQEIN